LKPRMLIAAVAIVLAGHAWLAVENLTMDGDTLRLAGQLAQADSLRASCSLLGPKVILYPLQPPFIWGAARAGAIVWPGWNTLSASRLLAILALVAAASLLALLAREAGAGAGGRAAAALFPFCWHGFSFLAASCDDNSVTGALRLAAVLAAVRWLSQPAGGRRHLVVGAALGAAMGWHFQSVLLFPGIAIAALWGWRRDGVARLRETAEALALGVAVWLALTGLCLGVGRAPAPSVGALAEAMVENHRDARLWFPSSPRPFAAHAAMVWEGWSRMALGFEWLRPPRAWLAVVGVTSSAMVMLAVSWAAVAGTALGRVVGSVLAIQIAHSLLYESESIERWDVPVIFCGLIAVAGVGALGRAGRAGAARRMAGGWWAFALALGLCNAGAWTRFARDAEPAFLDVVEGRRQIEGLSLDCVGAHWRLCRAVRGIASEVGPSDSFAGMLQAKVPDVFHQHYLTSWCSAYLVCYAPGFATRPALRRLWISLLRAPPRPFRIVRQEGFVYLAEPEGRSRP